MIKAVFYAIAFAAEAITAGIYHGRVMDAKRNWRGISIGYTVSYFVLFLLSLLNNRWLDFSAFLAVNIGLSFFLYTEKPVRLIAHNIYMSLMLLLVDIAVEKCLFIYTQHFTEYLDSLAILGVFSAISRLLFFGVMLASSRIFSKKRHERMDMSLIMLSVLPIISIVVCFTLAVLLLFTSIPKFMTTYQLLRIWLRFPDSAEGLIAVSIVIMLVINIAFYIIYSRVKKLNTRQLEYELRLQKEDARQEYYSMLEEQYNNQRILIHDIKRHTATLSSLLQDKKYEDMEGYLRELREDPALQRFGFCSEPVLNSILLRYRDLCDSYSVSHRFDIRLDSIDTMSAKDITALFDNLLSNAFEAAVDAEDKFMDVSVVKKNGDVLIKVLNSCKEAPASDGKGRFISRKKDGKDHGVGLRSIDRVLRRYSGDIVLEFSEEQKIFTAIVSFSDKN